MSNTTELSKYHTNLTSINNVTNNPAVSGIAGLIINYYSSPPNRRTEIIQQALNYGKEGTKFLLRILNDKQEIPEVKDVVYSLLFKCSGLITALNHHKTLITDTSHTSEGSAVNIYTKLNKLLKAKKWKQADLETERIMLIVAKRTEQGYLQLQDIENFPCFDLHIIDQLWLEHSGGKFGFSIQRRIYESLGGGKNYDLLIWREFGDRVGWRREGKWLDYSDINFTITAPVGHLPLWGDVDDGL
ncbi:GUN4 domain-containing protein [Cylindrospermopsis raciborskii]|uniref:GUN4 domain-containing protein n=1 Tax=Cylindrospermopsis raciborskii CENA302 TaxID=1170768 RepID=A0A9Q5R071_9CYAN|nr:GUN4 domain-containing protein [Cylindrospermopsis raciborskii]NLQ05416.1 GUN4 domain-containing protein [Cylindrospermopsis raciborskii MVCC19]OHY34498.1 hypothetical protein BCV64_05395 [Cylindrospermopsis raciborskii MVCC14]OPH11417.1 GUN4 domain-containing protein [Cylindrospermopsis raciborskii CENA302]